MERTEYVKSLIDDNWDSRAKFAKYIGIPPTTLQSILERGIGKASIDNVLKICKGLGIKADSLEEISSGIDNEGKLITLPSTQYEYFDDLKISAGIPITVEGITDNQTIHIPDFVLGHYAGSKDIFFAHINGESMNKVIQDGSLIAVKKMDIDHLKNGDIVVYSCCHEYAVKRFYRTDNGILFKPESTDYTFKDHEITNDDLNDLVIYGKVIYYGTTI